MSAQKFRKSLFQVFAFCFILSFGCRFVNGEETKYGLAIDNVHIFYFTEDERLNVNFVLINTGNREITVLTENLNTAFLDKSDKPICEIGAGIKATYKDYRMIQSLYRFDPVTLRPKEATVINHHVRRKPKNIHGTTDLIVRYKIEEDFGKRHNVWYGSIESTPIKVKIIK